MFALLYLYVQHFAYFLQLLLLSKIHHFQIVMMFSGISTMLNVYGKDQHFLDSSQMSVDFAMKTVEFFGNCFSRKILETIRN